MTPDTILAKLHEKGMPKDLADKMIDAHINCAYHGHWHMLAETSQLQTAIAMGKLCADLCCNEEIARIPWTDKENTEAGCRMKIISLVAELKGGAR